MSPRALGKKLLPAKKAWKAITDSLRSRLNKLKNSRTSPYTAHHHLHHSYHHYKYQGCDAYKKNVAPIYIDELFDEPLSVSSSQTPACAKGETSRSGTEVEGGKPAGETNGERECDIDERWRAIVAMSPQLRMDERAEEFISKFKEDMKLQRERSDIEFQERLRRSA